MQPPIRYVDILREKYAAQGFPPYDWTVNSDAPLTPLTKPLATCCVSLLSTSGASRTVDPPFDPDARNDMRCDAIPSDWNTADCQIHDNYYDHTDASRDLNCQFPMDRLRELAADGTIGSVAPHVHSGFMGRIYKRQQVVDDEAPKLVERLRADGVDVLVVVPACPLDHQTAGLVARVVEASGIPTVTVSTGRDLSELVLAPRTLFVNHPMGNAFGRPGEAERQRGILRDALALLERDVAPGAIVDHPDAWHTGFEAFMPDTDRAYQLKS